MGNIDNAWPGAANVKEWDKLNFMTVIYFTINWGVYNDWVMFKSIKGQYKRKSRKKLLRFFPSG